MWYKETGQGEPIIQIHGSGSGHFNFATATPILSQTFRCVDFDMRGYGQSERPFQQYSMEVWADDVAGLMDHLGVRTAHIHGTSMGGMVAQQFAAKYSDRVLSAWSSTAPPPSSIMPVFLLFAVGSTSPTGLASGRERWQSLSLFKRCHAVSWTLLRDGGLSI